MNNWIVGSQQAAAGFFEAMRAVFWSFFGVRSSNGRASDEVRISPLQAFVAGWIGVAIVIALLLAIVRVTLP